MFKEHTTGLYLIIFIFIFFSLIQTFKEHTMLKENTMCGEHIENNKITTPTINSAPKIENAMKNQPPTATIQN